MAAEFSEWRLLNITLPITPEWAGSQHSALGQNMEQVATSSDITQQMPHASTSQSYMQYIYSIRVE